MKLIKCSEQLPDYWHDVLWKYEECWHRGYLVEHEDCGESVMLASCCDPIPLSEFESWAELPEGEE